MKEWLIKNYKYIIVILIMVIVSFYFIGQKEGYHEDEIFSYGSSNYLYDNVYRPYGTQDSNSKFVSEKILNGNILKNIKYYYIDHTDEKDKILEEYENAHDPKWKDPEIAKDYLTLKGWKEAINYPAVYYNQSKDVHPPLFYFLVHTVQILFYGKFSKYIVFVINMCFMILSLITIKKIFEKMDKEYLAIPAMIFYGFSIGAISTIVFARMYMVLTFFVLMLISVNFDIVNSGYEIDKKTWLKLGITIVLGFLTQYYFCICAFAIGLIIFVQICRKHDKKKIISYIVNYLKIALIGILIYPSGINHIFFSYRGIGATVENKSYFEKLYNYTQLIGHSFSSNAIIVLLFMGIITIYMIVKYKDKFNNYIHLLWLSLVIYILAVTKTAPEFGYVYTLRYFMCILPIFAIIVVLCIDLVIKNKKIAQIIAITVSIIISIYGLATNYPCYLYKGYNKYLEVANNNKDDKFVYIGDTVFNHIQSMPEFTIYKSHLILNEKEIDLLKDNDGLKDEDEFILSIKKYKNNEAILKEIIEKTDFKEAEMLLDDDGEVGCAIYRMKRVNNEI